MSRPVFLLLFLASGCYGYYPATQTTPAGREVQITLTDSGSLVLARRVGPSAESLLGRVDTDSANAVVIAMLSVHQRDGNDTEWRGEHVTIPRSLMANLTERHFSRGRTALLGGVVGLAFVALHQAFQGTGFGSSGSGLPNGGVKK